MAASLVVQFVSKASQPEKAVEIFESMQQEANIQPNIYSYSSLISALARTGKWRDAEYYFMELKERGKTDLMCAPNAVTYAAMITGKSVVWLLFVVIGSITSFRHACIDDIAYVACTNP